MVHDLNLKAMMSMEIRHELVTVASGLSTLKARFLHKHPDLERERHLLDILLGRVNQLIQLVDHSDSDIAAQ